MEWTGLLQVAGVLLCVLLLLGVVYLVWRRRRLVSGAGTFECYLRRAGLPEKARWRHGIVRYQSDAVVWYPLLSLGFKPGCVIPRLRVQITPRREPTAVEKGHLTDGQAIVRIAADGPAGPVCDWAVAPSAINGLLAWAESAPPGEGQYGQTSLPSPGVGPVRRGPSKSARSARS